jgi:hypothetical protein
MLERGERRRLNNKGQMSLVFYVIIGVFAVGFILYQFYPSIDQVRIAALSNADPSNALFNFILYAMMPILIIAYLVLSVFAVVWAINGAQGSL